MNRRFGHWLGISACALLTWSMPLGASPREAPQKVPWVYLSVDRPEEPEVRWTPLLPRELIRQAVLLSAREEFGAATRDAVLRESTPADAAHGLSLDAATRAADRIIQLTLSPTDGEGQRIIEGTTGDAISGYVFGGDYPGIVQETEQWSRDQIVESLLAWGLEPAPTPINPDALLPFGVESLLGTFNEIAQYDAVRRLHQRMRSEGESPELLGALVRGYANLGQLSRYHFTAAEQVFYARALLYAQRLIARHGESRFAYWHRAYAHAMVGLDAVAIEDLQLAQQLDEATDPPAWVSVLDAYVHHRPAELESHRDLRTRSLAAYLRFVLAERTRRRAYMEPHFQRLIRLQPLCLRAIDEMARAGGVGNQHRTTTLGPFRHLDAMRHHLRPMPGLPADAARAVDAFDLEAWPAVPVPALTAALRSAADTDLEIEPSWAVVASLIQEPHLAQVYRRAMFMKFSWAVDVQAFLDAAALSLDGHRYAPMIDALRYDRRQEADKINERMAQVDFGDLNASAAPILDRNWWGRIPRRSELRLWVYQRMRHSADDTAHDISQGITDIYRHWPAMQLWFADHLENITPHSPIAAAVRVRQDWDNIQDQLPQWLERFGEDPHFTRHLAEQQIELGLDDDAERTLERHIAQVGERWAYRQLARLYRRRGDAQRAEATLERFIDEGADDGLAVARVRVEIAEQHMDRGQHAEALPHAQAAARTGSGWGMFAAARVAEHLGDWPSAEQWVRRQAQRYDGRQPSWYWWCRRTGRGDRAAAAVLARQYFDDLGTRLTRAQRLDRAVFRLLDGDASGALADFEHQFTEDRTPRLGLQAALIAHRIGDHAKRDALLEMLPLPRKAAHEEDPFVLLADVLRRAWAGAAEPGFEQATIESAVERLPTGLRTDLLYLAAEVAELVDETQSAEALRMACAQPVAPRRLYHGQVLALAALHAADIDPFAEPQPARVAAHPDRKPDSLYEEANRLLGQGLMDEAEPLLVEYIERTASLRGMRRLAELHIEAGRYALALPLVEHAYVSRHSANYRHASNVREFLGHFEASEYWIRRVTERGGGLAAEWYYWCIRTGRGDLAAARAVAKPFMLGVNRTVEPGAWQPPTYHLLEGDEERARVAFESAYEADDDPWLGLHLARLWARAGDVAQRNAVLEQIAMADALDDGVVNDADEQNVEVDRPAMVTLSQWFLPVLTGETDEMPTLEQIDELVRALPSDRHVNVYYFAATLFEIADDQDAAHECLIRCITPIPFRRVTQVLAYRTLRTHGHDPYTLLD